MPFTIGLSITSANDSSRDVVYDSENVLIGSGPSATLRLDHEGVSPVHAVLKVTPTKAVTVIDLGSTAGTTVNGVVVAQPVQIRVGDVLGIGPVELFVSELGEREAREASAAPSVAPGRVEPRSEPTLAPESLARSGSDPWASHRPTEAKPVPTSGVAGGRKPPAAGGASRDASRSRKGREKPDFEADGRTIVVDGDEVDPALLDFALDEADRPTQEAHALEIAILWGNTVIDAVEVKAARPIVVGPRSAGDSDLTLDGGFPEDRFTIALHQGGEAQILVPSGAKVALRRPDGQITRDVVMAPTDAPFPAHAYPLKLHERLAYKSGTITVVAQFVRGDAVLGAAAPIDWYFPRILAISALVFIFLAVAAVLTPVRARSLADDLFKNQNRFAQMILKAPEKEKRKKLDLSGMKGGAKAKDKEGKFGKKEKPKKDALASKAGAPRVDPNKREKDRKIAMNAGLLGMLKGGDAGAVSNVFGPGGLGTGINDAMGGLPWHRHGRCRRCRRSRFPGHGKGRRGQFARNRGASERTATVGGPAATGTSTSAAGARAPPASCPVGRSSRDRSRRRRSVASFAGIWRDSSFATRSN